jgi:hypothetical protein
MARGLLVPARPAYHLGFVTLLIARRAAAAG